MALVSKMVSDLTGKEGDQKDFVTLVVREHTAITEPKALDVLPDEIAALKSAGDLVVLEIRNPDTSISQLIVPLAEFRKIVKDEVLSKGRGLKGRRPGYSPNGGNGH